MTFELVIVVITCIATVANTFITLLAFIKKKDKE